MKRTTIWALAAVMGLGVLAPIAASADVCRTEVVVPTCREDVRIDLRDHDRWDVRFDRDHARVERVQNEHGRRDRR